MTLDRLHSKQRSAQGNWHLLEAESHVL